MNYILGAATAILVFCPGFMVAGYIMGNRDALKNLSVNVSWPTINEADLADATGSARRIRQ